MKLPLVFRSLLTLLALGAAASAQTTWWVDDDGPTDLGPGNPLVHGGLENGTAAAPFDTISEAIAAATSGDTILVKPSNPEHTGLHYWQASLVDLSGAGGAKTLTLRSTDGPEVTVLEGLGSLGPPFDTEILRADSGETAAYLVEGFTLRGADNSAGNDVGGGIRIVNSSPTIRNCVFEGNQAYQGGAAYLLNSATLFEDCTFMGNSAVHQGGAVHSENGSPTFSRCHFEGNTASFGAGYLARTTGGGAPHVVDCTFFMNEALVGYGGGIAKFDGGTILVERTRFVSNTCVTAGGGMLINGSGQVWDSVFNGNVAASGGGLRMDPGGGTKIAYNSTFHDNVNGGVVEEAGVIVGVLRNCIVWGNTGFQVGVNVDVQYTDVMGGYGGVGNKDTDPLFVNPLGLDGIAGTLDDDFSLMRESPCIDAGDTLLHTTRTPHVPNPLDLAGNPRAVNRALTIDSGVVALGLAVDMGAYEWQGFVPLQGGLQLRGAK